MYNLFKHEQDMIAMQSAERAARMGKRDKHLRKKLAESYALRVNKWMNESNIDDHPQTYREQPHVFRDTEKHLHLDHDRVSSKKYELERERIARSIDFERSKILNVNNGYEVYQDRKLVFRHRYPTKEIPNRARFHTRFTDTTKKLHRRLKDRTHISKLATPEDLEYRPKSPDERRCMTDSWNNLRHQSTFLWENDIPRKKPLEVPEMNRTTSPRVPFQLNVNLMKSKSGTFRKISTAPSKTRYSSAKNASRSYMDRVRRKPSKLHIRPAPVRNIKSAPSGEMSSAKMLAISSPTGRHGHKMYWKALKELSETSPTSNYGTKPRLTWTQVQACDSYQANTMMKSRYEYDDTWQSLGRSNSRLQL
mmetsp:Transcript_27614/g.44491  ORF Transcript_27614/g.44491 Transcript_27614/m.44491 type:complete len:364 (-) Transcript_27614:213-1304(-)